MEIMKLSVIPQIKMIFIHLVNRLRKMPQVLLLLFLEQKKHLKLQLIRVINMIHILNPRLKEQNIGEYAGMKYTALYKLMKKLVPILHFG